VGEDDHAVKPSDKEKFTATAYLKLLAYVHDLTYTIEADCWDPYLGPKNNAMDKLEKCAKLLDQFTAAMSRLPRKDVEEGIRLLKVEDVMES
jgi:hypothetical protein